MTNINPEESAAYRKKLAAVLSRAVKVLTEPTIVAPVPTEVVPVLAPIVPAKARPGSYEEFLAENAARLRLPGMVRGLGGCAVAASSINPFTGKPHSEDPPPGPILKNPSATSYDCEEAEPKQTFDEYYDEINKKNGQTNE